MLQKNLIFTYNTLILATLIIFTKCNGTADNNQSHNNSTAQTTSTFFSTDRETKANIIFDSIFALPQEDGENKLPKEEIYIDSLLEFLSKKESFSWIPKNENIKVATSDDQQLRAISWLSPYSGTIWYVQTILQYKTAGGNLITASLNRLFNPPTETGSPTPFITKIFLLPNSNPAYLLIGNGQMSGTEPYASAHVVEINTDAFRLNDNLFPNNASPFEKGTAGQRPDFDYDTKTQIFQQLASKTTFQFKRGKFYRSK